jgi:MSHA biogenesis protein MshG
MFRYRGRNARGEVVNGAVEAASADAVAAQLLNSGVTPVDISAARGASQDIGAALRFSFAFSTDRIQPVDIVIFSRQLHTLLKAGVPIMQGLRSLRDSTHNPALSKVIHDLVESLDSGLELSAALKRHPKVFANLYISMVQVGETTGGLPEALLQLAAYLDREKDTRDRIKQALRYPLTVIGAIVVAMFIINILVIPTFAKVYANFRAELPFVTRLLVAVSGFFERYWGWMAAGIAGSLVWLRLYIKSSEGRYRWDKLKLHVPIVGVIFRNAALARFTRTLAIALRAGVPLVQAFTVVSRAVDNEFIGERILQMRDGVERGETITRTATATGMFPPLVVQMISVGEETGAMDSLLDEVADHYDREVDYALKNLSTALEPILIVMIGVMVLILALGVFLPMWNLAKAVRH